MLNKRYYLQLELNMSQHIIFAINEEKKGCGRLIGYLYLEDLKRAGTPKDFEFLNPVFLEDWDDFRNLIVARVITYENISAEEKEELLFLASTMIEFKPAVNHKVEFFISKELSAFSEDYLKENCMKDNIPIYQWIIENMAENPINLEKITEGSLNYLSQD
ncbi:MULTISPECIES: hypothetical protein [Bacillaceae]|uniref:hypothetical protein n=1 Tax=Bacillaceae TaxID=186817 RepID=UPI001E65C1C1|nr:MULTISPECIES: hypothetical protein [Bacillaceae]MCE4048090.1 hypothetical protein [Bacillus sp. Au-Bac7]MCM3032669.1 hypothetical protein [Niallia sp. MER 6]